MSNINNITLGGRLVREPVVRTGINGSPYGMFTLAVNHRWTDRSGNTQTETAFVPCRCFGPWADALKGTTKGDTLLVTGRLRTESFEKDGTRVSQLGLVCATVHCIGSRAREESNGNLTLNVVAPENQPTEKEAVPF